MTGKTGLMLVLCGVVGCGALKDAAKDARVALVDCTTAQAAQLIDEFSPTVAEVIEAARGQDGQIDWSQVRASLKHFGIRTGACVVADLVAGVLAGKQPFGGVVFSPVEASEGFAFLRKVLWRDAQFKTEAGTI